ncbi:MAG: dynamin family protein [Synergistaceae bacterium]|nr:dynamin family protein [Synergistaceae bacterium]
MHILKDKIHAIISAEDLSGQNISTTAKIISANPEKFYLLAPSSGFELFEAIEKLSENIYDKNLLTCVRIANEINFSLGTYLHTGNAKDIIKLHKFSELLELLEYDEAVKLKPNDYHVVIDDSEIEYHDDNSDEASRMVALLLQQTIHLNLDLDIKKKSEINKSLIKNRFRANYLQLKQEVITSKEFIDGIISGGNLTQETRKRAEKMTSLLDAMLAEFEKAKKRPIKIAAMGTKKAGKSLIINSILKRDFAPTSSELPTPNVIKYSPEKAGTPLTLEYEGRTQIFDSPEELKKFISIEFKKAQKAGSGLANMTIKYPSDDFSDFKVWDTPGPNYAGAGDEHRKIAEECISSADICIFVVNYSSHETDDEINFLREISSCFRENKKFYSLFIAINRIDERYASTDEKSVNRLVDYIRFNLDRIGYKNIVLFGTSALQNFYLEQVLEILAKSGIEVDRHEPIEGFIKRFKKSHTEIWKKFLTQFTEVEKAIMNLENFHGIFDPSASDIFSFSGIPQFERYLKYIGGQKVDTEIVDSIISRCEGQFDQLKNAQLILDMLDLSDKDKEDLEKFAKLIEGLTADVRSAIDEISNKFGDEQIYKALNEIQAAIKDNRRVVLREAEEYCDVVIDEAELNDYDIQAMREKRLTPSIEGINENIADAVIAMNRRSARALSDTAQRARDDYGRRVETGILTARQKISARTEEVKNQLGGNVTASELMKSFKIPDFPPSLEKMSFTDKNFDVEVDEEFLQNAAESSHHVDHKIDYRTETVTKTRMDKVKKTRTETVTKTRIDAVTRTRKERRRRSSRGFWEGVCSFFGRKYFEYVDVKYNEYVPVNYDEDIEVEYYDDVEVEYQENIRVPFEIVQDVYDVETFKGKILYKLKAGVRKVIEEAHDEIEAEAEGVIRMIYGDIKRQCDEINAEYLELFESFRDDIRAASDKTSAHKQALEKDIDVLREIDNKLGAFFDMWYKILHS